MTKSNSGKKLAESKLVDYRDILLTVLIAIGFTIALGSMQIC